MDELRRAMIVASGYWRGTSLTDGALHFLAQVYGPHPHQGDAEECSQCGKAKADPLHQ